MSISVWACLIESTRHCYFNFYYEYKMRLLWTVLLSGASVLWCCAPSCGNSVGWCVDRYQSLRNQASEALHLLKGAVCDLPLLPNWLTCLCINRPIRFLMLMDKALWRSVMFANTLTCFLIITSVCMSSSSFIWNNRTVKSWHFIYSMHLYWQGHWYVYSQDYIVYITICLVFVFSEPQLSNSQF